MSQFIQQQSGGSGGDMEIGLPVIHGTPYSKLFIDANGNLAENSQFYFNTDAINELTAFTSRPVAYLQPSLSNVIGLNDIIVDVTGITINPSQLIVTIQSTNEYNYVENGVHYSTPITMGAPHTTPNGAKINFGSLTGYTPGDSFFFVCMRNRTQFNDGLIPLTKSFGWERSIGKTGQAISQRVEFDITTGDARAYETVERTDLNKKSERINIGSSIEDIATDTASGLSARTFISPTKAGLRSFDGAQNDQAYIEKDSFNIQSGHIIKAENIPAGAVALNAYFINTTTTGTYTLPNITSDIFGKVFIIKNTVAGVTATVEGTGGQLIDGATSVALATHEGITVIALRTPERWAIISQV